MKKNILGEMMKTARLSAKKHENDIKLGSSKKKRIKKQVTGLMKRSDEKLIKNEKSELEAMFERMKRKKNDENMVKTEDLKMKKESTMKNGKDEKKMSYDEKNTSRKVDKQFNPPKLKHPEKVSQKEENILKVDVKMMKKDEMNYETDENEAVKMKNGLVIGLAGNTCQNSPKFRTFSDVMRLKNRFEKGCSPTTTPLIERKKRKISRRLDLKNETSLVSKVLIAGYEKDEKPVIASMNSPGKRKFEVAMSKSKNQRVQELIDNFEVGSPSKRKKVGRDCSRTADQLHLC